MAFIDYISFDHASPELRGVYEKMGGPKRTPSNVVRVSGASPKLMEQHVELFKVIMYGKSPLSRFQREMIAVRVSALSECHY